MTDGMVKELEKLGNRGKGLIVDTLAIRVATT